MFGLLLSVAFFILIFGFVYLDKQFLKLPFIKKIKNKFLRFIISLIPVLIVFIFLDFINAIVFIIHLFFFTSLAQFILFIIKKTSKKAIGNYYIVIFGFIITFIYMGVGMYLDYHVFETHYEIETTKDIGMDKLRIVQISDSHVGTTFDGKGFKKHIEKINKKNADLVVITGDFVDDDTPKEDMIESCKALSLLKTKYGVYYIEGNHDKGYFNNRNYSFEDLLGELDKNNVIILRDKIVEVTDKIYIVGRNDATYSRLNINTLLKDVDRSKYIIDLNHQPNDYENEKNAKVDLVLSGHTHGGQLFPLGPIGVLFKANDNYYGLEKRDDTYFIVNSGISNWRLKFKTGTKSEYGVIDIINKK